MTIAKSGRVFLLLLIVITLLPALTILAETDSESTRAPPEENWDTYILLEVANDDKEILPSGSVNFQIIVRNLDKLNDTTYLPPSSTSFSLPTGWEISIKPSSEMFIPADKFDIFNVTLAAPSDAKADTEIELKIIGSTSAPNTKILNATITTRVREIYDITLNTISNIKLESPIDPQYFKISMKNNGNVDDRIELRITDIPTGLVLSQDSQQFIIDSGMTDSITITLYPSSILTAGEYKLNISLYRITSTGKSWVSSQDLWVDVDYYPDLIISSNDIELSKYVPCSGENININITIHNKGDSDARNVTVSIIPITKSESHMEEEFEDEVIAFLGMNTTTKLSIPWVTGGPAIDTILVILDPENDIAELDEKNNEAELRFTIVSDIPYHPEDSEVGKYTFSQVAAVGVVGILACALVAMFAFYASTDYGKFALFKLLIPFYTRVKKEEVLNHEVRELVYDYVQSHPGEHFRAILTKLGLTNGTLIHHLQTLERQEFIKSERDGPFKRFYPSGRQFTEEVLEINGIQKKILDAVTANPGITQKDIAHQLHTSAPTINYHRKALRGVRLINIKRDGKSTRCFPGHSLNGWYRSGVS